MQIVNGGDACNLEIKGLLQPFRKEMRRADADMTDNADARPCRRPALPFNRRNNVQENRSSNPSEHRPG